MGPSQVRASRQIHSPTGRQQQIDGQVQIDEPVAGKVENCADAVAGVGGDGKRSHNPNADHPRFSQPILQFHSSM
jgi:hypothetical protein